MNLSERRMESNSDIEGITHSSRNDWGKHIEEIVRERSPYPISYDVDATQHTGFSEFTYTEFLGGVLIQTQSVEINCRSMLNASMVETNINHCSNLKDNATDKYNLEEVDTSTVFPKDVCFMVGQNMFDIVDIQHIARLYSQNEDFVMKLHPLTGKEMAGVIANVVTWNNIASPELSGVQMLKNCETAYVSTASELCSLAVALDKHIVNVSAFFNESSGAYYAINKLLFNNSNPKQTLNNIIDCKHSGIIMPWMTDIEERMDAYYSNALKLRDMYKPLSTKSKLKKPKE